MMLGTGPRSLARPRRLTAIALISLSGGIALAFIWARGSLAGADALAYWSGARAWLAGADPYHPGTFVGPYVYAPWLLPLLVPWALLPWPLAPAAWRGAMLLLFLWSFDWAYRRRPLATAVAVTLMAAPIGLVLESGNVTLFLALALWAAQFSGPRAGGALWALAAATKWFPAALWFVLPRPARRRGLAAVGVAALLAAATWPQTLEHLAAAMVVGLPRLGWWIRLDHAAILWAIIPWLWRHPATLGAPARWGRLLRTRPLLLRTGAR